MTLSSPRYTVTMPTTFGPRTLRRFTRPASPPRYVLTERDIRFLEALARYRDLSVDQISRLERCSVRAARARLFRLWADKVIDRPAQQGQILASHYHNGPAPLVYRLTRKGADVLAARGFPLDHRLDWTFRTGTTPALAHNAAVADVMIAFRLALAPLAHLGLVDHHDLIPDFPEATRLSRRPFALAVDVDGKRLTNVPDRVFAVAAGDERVNLALELDTGSEVLEPRRPTTKPSIQRKLTVYNQSFVQQVYGKLWNMQRLRVLFIVPSQCRLENMLELWRQVSERRGGAGMCLFTTHVELAANGPLAPIWSAHDGAKVSLLPASFLSPAIQEPR